MVRNTCQDHPLTASPASWRTMNPVPRAWWTRSSVYVPENQCQDLKVFWKLCPSQIWGRRITVFLLLPPAGCLAYILCVIFRGGPMSFPNIQIQANGDLRDQKQVSESVRGRVLCAPNRSPVSTTQSLGALFSSFNQSWDSLHWLVTSCPTLTVSKGAVTFSKQLVLISSDWKCPVPASVPWSLRGGGRRQPCEELQTPGHPAQEGWHRCPMPWAPCSLDTLFLLWFMKETLWG